jgi:hypothetical protein
MGETSSRGLLEDEEAEGNLTVGDKRQRDDRDEPAMVEGEQW